MREHYCAIVGLGGMGNWHRELIKGEGSWNDRACGPIEHLHLAGSFDIRGERQAYARSVGLHTYGCLEELLSDEKVDIVLCATVPFPVSWTVKMKKKQKETQDILSYHTQAAGCSDKARAKASGGRQPIEECGRTGL